MKKIFSIEILKNKNFLKIWSAQVFSLVSAYTINFILIGRIFSVTHSAVAVSFLLFLYFLPTVVLGPFVGVFIDNLSKRKIFILSNLFQAIVVLAYLGVHDKVWLVYGIIFIYSICDEFFNPAVGAALPALVKRKNLPAANSLFALTSQGSVIVGSLIGGLALKFLKWVDSGFVFASLLLFLATGLSLILPKKPLGGMRKVKFDLDLSSFWQQTKEGYRFIRHEPLVLLPILLLAGLQGVAVMALMILPSLAQMLKIDFADSSYFIIIPVICGAILASFWISKKSRKVRKNILVLNGLYLMGATIFLLAVLTLFFIKPVPIAMLLILGLGASYVLILIPLQTLIQESTPFDVRGRVFGVLNMALNLGSVLPLLITATLVDLLGLRGVLIGGGVAILFLAAFVQRKKAMILTRNN